MCFELTPISRVQEMGGSSFDVGAFSVLRQLDRELTASWPWADRWLAVGWPQPNRSPIPFKKIVSKSGQKSLFLF